MHHLIFINLFILKFFFLLCRFDCGTGAAVLQSPEEVVMGQWNRLVVARNNNQGSLQLNSANVVEATAPVCDFGH